MKKQISLEGMIFETELVEFDDTAIYISKGDQHRVVKLHDILSFSRTGLILNNRCFWEIWFRIEKSTKKGSVKFRGNSTFWNKNFPQFHNLLSSVNPEAIKSPYRWWAP